MGDAALLVIAIDVTILTVLAVVYLYQGRRLAKRMERLTDQLETLLQTFSGVGEETRRVVGDVRSVSRELNTVVGVLGVSKRTRATLVGARAAVEAFRRHSDGTE
jgi:hypothetical protein